MGNGAVDMAWELGASAAATAASTEPWLSDGTTTGSALMDSGPDDPTLVEGEENEFVAAFIWLLFSAERLVCFGDTSDGDFENIGECFVVAVFVEDLDEK